MYDKIAKVYLFINLRKLSVKGFELLFESLDIRASSQQLGDLIDRFEQRLHGAQTFFDVYLARNLVSSTSHVQGSEAAVAEHLVVIAAVVYSRFETGVVLSVRSTRTYNFANNITLSFLEWRSWFLPFWIIL